MVVTDLGSAAGDLFNVSGAFLLGMPDVSSPRLPEPALTAAVPVEGGASATAITGPSAVICVCAG